MSSTGYTPAFASIYDGSLCGKWPAAAVMASLLPLIDQRGNIDMSPQAIASRTGWPMDLLMQGIGQLMEPDPDSRSPAEQGRRLVLIEQGRKWGWRVVNHGHYREKARLMAKSAREVETGANANRMAQRDDSRSDRRPPPETAGHPLSYSNPDTDTDPSGKSGARAREHGQALCGMSDVPEDATGENAWREVGCDAKAMEAWLEHCATGLNPPKVVNPAQRIAIAKMLAGMGDAAAQLRAVQFCAGNGFRNLRHTDGQQRPASAGGRKTFEEMHARAAGRGID